MVNSALSSYSYSLTPGDRIASVENRWLAFAQENGASELTRENVIGKPLSEFISGTDTQKLYAAILRRVRRDDIIAVLPFRCDSPTMRREMIMRIGNQSADLVTVTCTLVKVEPTGYMRLLDRTARRNLQQLTLCSICLKALVEPVGWLEVEDAAISLHLLEQKTAPSLHYTICPSCTNRASQPLDCLSSSN